MSSGKKSLRKRKRQSPPPSTSSSVTTSKVNRRLDKLRAGRRNNLWLDDEDDDNDNRQQRQPQQPAVQSKPVPSNKTYIVLSDSDEEKPPAASRQRSRSNKARQKSSPAHADNYPSDNDYKRTPKCATCLICSILSTLSSYNCCSKHLSLLTNSKKSVHKNSTVNIEQYSPQHVMILPMTDELVQRYLNHQGSHHLRTQISTSSKKTIDLNKSSRKILKKSRIITESSDNEHSGRFKSSMKPTYVEPDQSTSSSSATDSNSLAHLEPNPPDTTFTVITSTSSTINSFESPNALDTCQLQQSSDQPIVIDDSQPDSQVEPLSTHVTDKNEQSNPWAPISDDTYAAIEVALNQVHQGSEEQTEFTPAAARRTPTNLMASCLPKIQLKKGRYRQAPNECLPSTTPEISSNPMSTNVRAPHVLATIFEGESLVISPTTAAATNHLSEKSSQSSHLLSQRHENSSEGLSDTVMSNLFAQDESSQQEIHLPVVKLHPPAIIIEDYSNENEKNRSNDISQSSQLSNDQNDSQPLIPSSTNEKTTVTPSRVSYRTNPDGTRVSISRPALPINYSSSLTSTRRVSTDVTSTTPSHSNK
ncbi:unnamed protein product [Adineta ricciae]|uniref:Uncharacterized protein n=1 Tax=Adineta ricciae TaxID=249248 RepID=A0A813N7Z5_ADIRI|nr:unnamed protein product [Adineta ricciae]